MVCDSGIEPEKGSDCPESREFEAGAFFTGRPTGELS